MPSPTPPVIIPLSALSPPSPSTTPTPSLSRPLPDGCHIEDIDWEDGEAQQTQPEIHIPQPPPSIPAPTAPIRNPSHSHTKHRMSNGLEYLNTTAARVQRADSRQPPVPVVQTQPVRTSFLSSLLSSIHSCFSAIFCCRYCTSASANATDSASYGRPFTLGEKVADIVSEGVGSWYFVITQSMCLAFWIVMNASTNYQCM